MAGLIDQAVSTTAPAADRRTLERSEQLAMLTQATVDDMLAAFGLGKLRRGRKMAALLCRRAACGLASTALAYDDQVAAEGLRAGGGWALRQFAVRLEVSGARHVPASGPLLIAANHPGLSDTLALFSAIARPDLRVIAEDRLFLRALPHTSRHLLYIDHSAASRFGALRAATLHLRAGGAMLLFPAGQIEPDPAVLDGAEHWVTRWSDSIDALARLAPGITTVPAIISGVLSPAALRHPLIRLRRRPKDRQLLAAMLQILLPSLQGVTVRLAFGRALRVPADEPVGALVKAEARRLLQDVRARQEDRT